MLADIAFQVTDDTNAHPAALITCSGTDFAFGSAIDLTRIGTVTGAPVFNGLKCNLGVFNLLYGDLAGVATYALDGGRCSIGDTGTYTWGGVPAGSLYFLVVGTNGVGTESSWGTDSELNERNGAAASGVCLVSGKSTHATCP